MVTFPVHVNIASDPNEGWSVHMTLPPIPPAVLPSLEVPVEQRWWPGAGKHKITSTVLHRGLGIVQHGHDCGPFILDEAPPVLGRVNGYLPIMAFNSSRKVMFGASTVRAEGVAIGGAERGAYPMLTCGNPLSLPRTFPTKNKENTVIVGLTMTDILRGWEDIQATIAVDLFCYLMSIASPGGGILGLVGFDGTKTIASAMIGLKLSIERSAESGWREPISLKLETGAAASEALEIIYDPQTDDIEVVYDKAWGPFGFGAKRDKDGDMSSQERLPPDPFNQPEPTGPHGAK
jgi:hypothetical protein